MALFEISNDTLTPISEATFAKLGLLERANIQRALRSHINTVTPGIETMVLAEEFGDWEGANRRIDLLCLDENARLVVVEIKRDRGAHMELQAIRYAAMISTMRFHQAVEAHRKYLRAISGSIVSFDRFVVVLSAPAGSTQAIYKSAISTIQLQGRGREPGSRLHTDQVNTPDKETATPSVVTRKRRPAKSGREEG